MNTSRINKVISYLTQENLTQVIISDPIAIDYVIGKMFHPNQRLLALLLKADGDHTLFVNKIFPVEEDLGIRVVSFSDTDPQLEIIKEYLNTNEPLGIDKKLAARFLIGLMEINAATAYKHGSFCVDKARQIKDEDEKEKMITASRINDEAMAIFKTLLKPGITEREVASQMEGIYKSLGADGLSFGPIVSFGANAAIAHHKPDDTVLKEGDCVLLDVGCKKDKYCSDMTRTFFYKSVSEKQKEIYNLVLNANLTAQKQMKVGMKFSEIDAIARNIIKDAGYGEKFTHRLGHCIGLEVHDAGDVASTNHEIVKEGMIFSCEPGVYLSGEFGVRIEDLILMSKDGAISLNKDSKELLIVE